MKTLGGLRVNMRRAGEAQPLKLYHETLDEARSEAHERMQRGEARVYVVTIAGTRQQPGHFNVLGEETMQLCGRGSRCIVTELYEKLGA